MDDLTQCSIIRDDLKKWLDVDSTPLEIWQDEKPLITLLKLFKQPLLIDYLFRTNSGDVSWKDSLTFCGVFSMKSGALYLTKNTASLLAECPAPYVAESVSSMKEELAGRINQQVEAVIANDRKNLSVRETTGWRASKELRDYLEYGAQEEAVKRFFDDNAPDGQFHSSYSLNELPEAAFLDYIQDPEGFIQNEADQFIKMNQERFLLQFLRNDALLMKYEAVMQDTANPIHRVKAISEAIKISGAKSVNVTVQKGGEELSFKTGTTPLRGRYNSYSSSHIAAADRQEFERLFGRYSNYSAEDIIRITYGKKTIYEATPAQCEDIGQETAPEMTMGGM